MSDMPTAKAQDAWTGMHWLSPPPSWSVGNDGVLTATSGDKTDFWQRTYYGFRRDDGHAYMRSADGAFSATLTYSGDYEELYDQAGLLLRVDQENWVKFGIERTDGAPHLSVVVTRDGWSDWSAQPVTLSGALSLRATTLGDGLLLEWSQDSGRTWAMSRLAPCPRPFPLQVGPYLCSPERAGFVARFHSFSLTKPLVDTLHS